MRNLSLLTLKKTLNYLKFRASVGMVGNDKMRKQTACILVGSYGYGSGSNEYHGYYFGQNEIQ